MKILYSASSPYAAKVRMAARHCRLDFEQVPTDPNADPAELIDNNPLGKIPALFDDDGTVVFDSRAIMQFLDRRSGRKLFPRNAARRTQAEVLER
jgi:glutathione S-transferase